MQKLQKIRLQRRSTLVVLVCSAIINTASAQAMQSEQSASTAKEDLKHDLVSLRDAQAIQPGFLDRVNSHLMAMAEKTHEPSYRTRRPFVTDLVRALNGRLRNTESAALLVDYIHDVLWCASRGTMTCLEAVRNFEHELVKTGVPRAEAGLVSAGLNHIGEDVRGPQDAPIK